MKLLLMSFALSFCAACHFTCRPAYHPDSKPARPSKASEPVIPTPPEASDSTGHVMQKTIWYELGTGVKTTPVLAYAYPEDILESKGLFSEIVSTGKKNGPGGLLRYSYSWRVLKPGTVYVWLQESTEDIPPGELPYRSEPSACYRIDEKLNVTIVPKGEYLPPDLPERVLTNDSIE